MCGTPEVTSMASNVGPGPGCGELADYPVRHAESERAKGRKSHERSSLATEFQSGGKTTEVPPKFEEVGGGRWCLPLRCAL
jgi:hypothetical protein